MPWSAAPSRTRHERLLARRLRVVDRPQERHLQPVDLVAELRQHRDQQRVRDQHGREHAEGAADAELRHEVEAEERETADGDCDGQAREQDGPPRGRTGIGGSLTG